MREIRKRRVREKLEEKELKVRENEGKKGRKKIKENQ